MRAVMEGILEWLFDGDPQGFMESSFSWPMLPASVLLLLVLIYWMFVIIGALDIEIFDFDLDIDLDAEGSVVDIGFVPLRFLNLGSVPLMLWLSIFSISFWGISATLNEPATTETVMAIGLVVLRDIGVACLITKILTQPLRGKFDVVEPNPAKGLIGNRCTITTSKVSETFGEAEYATEGAPLRLMVRAADESLTKGDIAEIVDYSPEENVYFVRKANREV